MYNNNNIILIINEGNVNHNMLLNSTKAPDIIARLLIDDVYGLNVTGENNKQKNNKTQINVDLNKIKQLAKKLSNYDLSNFTDNKHTNNTNINKNTILQILQYMLQSIHTIDTNSVSKDKVLNVLTYMLESINAGDKSNNNIISKDKVLSILNYMLERINADSESNNTVDKDKVLSILNYMLERINADSESNTVDSGVWKLICFKKGSPSHNNGNIQYDLYRLADEKKMAELKEKLNIDYFALQYTVKQPTELERYLGNVKPYMSECNCQIMAFTEDHKPLPQFSGAGGKTSVFIQKTNNKNVFELIPGAFPVIKQPTNTFAAEDFIKTIDQVLQKSDDKTKQLMAEVAIYYNKMLEVIYNDLKAIKTKNNVNLADVVVTQFVDKNDQLEGPIKDVFNDILVSTAKPIITDITNNLQQPQQNQEQGQKQPQQNNQQSDQQLLSQFETQLKQKLPSNQNYVKLKQQLQNM